MKFKLACQTLTKQGKRPCMAPGIHGGYSRGPTTVEGKAKSAQNIIKYNDQRASNNREDI